MQNTTTVEVDSPAEATIGDEEQELDATIKLSQEDPGPSKSLSSTSSSSSAKATYKPLTTSSLKRKKTNKDDERLEKAFGILASSANQLNDDSCHFGNLVASKLRIYDERVRCAIQNDIMAIFIRASTGYYNDKPNDIDHHHNVFHYQNPSPGYTYSIHSSDSSTSQTHIPSEEHEDTTPTFPDDFNIQELI